MVFCRKRARMQSLQNEGPSHKSQESRPHFVVHATCGLPSLPNEASSLQNEPSLLVLLSSE